MQCRCCDWPLDHCLCVKCDYCNRAGFKPERDHRAAPAGWASMLLCSALCAERLADEKARDALAGRTLPL